MKSKQFAHFMSLWSITMGRRTTAGRRTESLRVTAAKRSLRNCLPAHNGTR